MIIYGYTLERGDFELTEGAYARAAACENVLSSLQGLVGPSFDLVVVDGNHAEDYLAREIAAIRRLLASDGVVVFDHIGDWPSVAAVFKRVSGDERFLKLGDDGRIGILQFQTAAQPVQPRVGSAHES